MSLGNLLLKIKLLWSSSMMRIRLTVQNKKPQPFTVKMTLPLGYEKISFQWYQNRIEQVFMKKKSM